MSNIVIVSVAVLVGFAVLLAGVVQGNSVNDQGNTSKAAPLGAKPYCESQKGKSNNWNLGCKGGWYDHDRCLAYNPQSGDYANGYKVGWDKGVCKK